MSGRGFAGDYAMYVDALAPVSVDLATGTATGGAGRDRLISIECVQGSQHNDTLKGNSARNFLIADSGNDTIDGRAGPDQLAGAEGDDILWGRDGDDYLEGGNGNDTIYGGYGNDALFDHDNSAVSSVWGGRGADHFSVLNQSVVADFNPAEGDSLNLADIATRLLSLRRPGAVLGWPCPWWPSARFGAENDDNAKLVFIAQSVRFRGGRL